MQSSKLYSYNQRRSESFDGAYSQLAGRHGENESFSISEQNTMAVSLKTEIMSLRKEVVKLEGQLSASK